MVMSFFSALLWVIYGFVYRLNQNAVRQTLEPRRQNLLRLVNHFQQSNDDGAPGDLMEWVANLSKPSPREGFDAPGRSVAILNRAIPTWRAVGTIVFASIMGALVGLASGLVLRIGVMGPVLFQVLVGAVVPFEWMVGWMAWRAYQCDSMPAWNALTIFRRRRCLHQSHLVHQS